MVEKAYPFYKNGQTYGMPKGTKLSLSEEERKKRSDRIKQLHAQKLIQHGKKIIPPLIDLFREKYIVTDDGCWQWIASTSVDGYGQFWVGTHCMKSHQFAHIYFKGDVVRPLNVLHKCDNPGCCNPDHLFLGTHRENMEDMASKGRGVSGNSLKTHCNHGHPYDSENTAFTKNGSRKCKICMERWQQTRKDKRNSLKIK